jgi:hypothetical protein
MSDKKIQDISILYKIELIKEPHIGEVIEHVFDIEDLEEDGISDWILEEDFYSEGIGWPTDYYKILERSIV